MSDLAAEIARLETLSSAELCARWSTLTATPVPRVSPRLLRLALAWEIQARALGGLSRATSRTLDQRAGAKTSTMRPRAGTRLVREWQGRVHLVEVAEDQAIRWDGRTWASLSAVARAITGTRWSGPAFFGLKQKQTRAAA